MKNNDLVNIFCLITMVFLSGKLPSQGVSFEWVRQSNGISINFDKSIAVDKSGNVYSVGRFEGMNVDFDPGPDTFLLNSNGGTDIFIQKLDSLGNFVWAKNIGGLHNDAGVAIAVDKFDKLFITGDFQGKVDFDPGPDSLFLKSNQTPDVFVQKLNSLGNLEWVRKFDGPTKTDHARSIVIDNSGNVITTGYFRTRLNFYFGNLPYPYIEGGGDKKDVYIVKLDSLGNFVWAKSMGGPNTDSGYSVAVDAFNNVFTTGVFSGTVDFDPGPGTFHLSSASLSGAVDAFVQKLDPEGNFVWAKRTGGKYPSSIKADAMGNVCVAGFFNGTDDFDPGPEVFELISSGQNDIYIQKLDGSGNLIWVRHFAGIRDERGASLDIDSLGCIYVTGDFSSRIDFDPGPETYYLTSIDQSYDIFIQKLSPGGSLVWAKKIGYLESDGGNTIAVDPRGNIYVTGYFNNNVNFNPQGIGQYLNSNTGEGRFILKLHNAITTSQKVEEKENGFRIFPIPTADILFIEQQDSHKLDIRIYNEQGQLIISKPTFDQQTRINIKDQPPGMYYLFMNDGNRFYAQKIVKF